MKTVIKKEPNFYSNFISKNKPKIWKTVSQEIGFECRIYMLSEEQNFQCAYTEISIEPENAHIDHFIKQSFIKSGLFSVSITEWNNLFTTCNYEYFGAKHKDKNIKKEDYNVIINPAKDNPNEYFDYTFTGEILPINDNQKARKTIELFNLNDNGLVEQRKTVAEFVKLMYNQFAVNELVNSINKFESFIRTLYKELTKNNEEYR